VTEKTFVVGFTKSIRNRPLKLNGSSCKVLALREFKIPGCGIADIVLVPRAQLPRANLDRGLLAAISASESFAAYFCVSSASWAHNPARVAAHLGVSERTARDYVRRLREVPAYAQKKYRERLLSLDLWAVEAKLHDWRRALRQALKYTSYSVGSIVLMPFDNAKHVLTHVDRIRRMGLGLWAFDEKSFVLDCYTTPRRRRALRKPAKVRSAASFLLNFPSHKPRKQT
jgi:hypothetical protein